MEIAEIQVDITSYCNSHCGGCIRNDHGGEAAVELTHLPLETFKKINFDTITKFFFNGAYGDFTMHPEAIDIIDSIPRHIICDFNTNGGARNVEWWTSLGNKLNEFDLARVTFSFDGIDTNHLYRRGVDMQRALAHAAAFIKATGMAEPKFRRRGWPEVKSGGMARWKMVVFEHNLHEVERASQLAKDMGFAAFELEESYAEKIRHKLYKNFDSHTAIRAVPPREHEWKIVRSNWPGDMNDGHPCSWRNQRKVQLDSWGNLWQCCFMPGIKTHPYYYRELMLFNLDINLNEHSFDDIINGEFMTQLFDEPLELCKTCKEWTA
jgi:hypothetical protein